MSVRNWQGKELRKLVAEKHTQKMAKDWASSINCAIRDTKLYGVEGAQPNYAISGGKPSQVIIEPLDSTAAVYEYTKHAKYKTAVLNFASYKNPGGKFIEGSQAQEECLCHASDLYNVLQTFDNSYYAWNRSHLNRSLYMDRGLYTPMVDFVSDEGITICDVITVAAPNYGAAHKYQNVGMEENLQVLESRIRLIMNMAVDNEVEILILGAFGCGVFRQDATKTAKVFKKVLKDYPQFEKVVFAIPTKFDKHNYDSFVKVFTEEEESK